MLMNRRKYDQQRLARLVRDANRSFSICLPSTPLTFLQPRPFDLSLFLEVTLQEQVDELDADEVESYGYDTASNVFPLIFEGR